MNGGNASDAISESLNQSDIDRLMQESKGEATGVVYRWNGERYESKEGVAVELYDFRNPVFLTENELRQIRIRHEKFIHYLSARLSLFLRMDFGMKMSKLYTTSYQKFIESIPNPTHIALFKVSDLTGIGIFDISPRLAMSIVNRMLGGRGHSVQEERYLTEIEATLIDDIVHIILDEWCNQWQEYKRFNVSLVGRESTGRFLQTAPQDAVMLVVDVESSLGDCYEQFQIGIPYFMMEPIVKYIQASGSRYQAMSSAERKAVWSSSYSNISVPVVAEWPGFPIAVGDVLQLRPGDIIEMPMDFLRNTHIRLKNTLCFVGESGIEDGNVAIKILRKIEEE